VVIQDLTTQASLELLARTRLGRLACTQGAQPYLVPFYFVYHDNALYSLATVRQKIEWMRANPLVCVEVDEIVSQQEWVSVIVFGRYEELPDTPEWHGARAAAHKLLQKSAMWWEPAYGESRSTKAGRAPWCQSSTAFTSFELPASAPPLDLVTSPDTRLSDDRFCDSGSDNGLVRQPESE
jgi:uncharacterized protein